MLTYNIRTNYAKPRELQETIKSCMKQFGDKEIIVCGIMPDTDPFFKHVTFFDCKEYAEQGYTSKMRDKGIVEANGEFIVCLDDDIVLLDNFQENITSDMVQIPVCENIRGGRFWDWAILDHPELGHRKVDYSEQFSEYNYLSGQAFIIRSDVAKKNLHNSDLKFHQSDDVDYSDKLKKAGYKFTMNQNCKCIHNDPRYIESFNGLGVFKYE